MKIKMLIAPDFPPERFAGWHMLNTWLQKNTGLSVSLLTPASAKEEDELARAGGIDVIYANPFDATGLIREYGFKVIAKPANKSNEMTIVTKASEEPKTLDSLTKGCTIAMADNKDVKLIGLRLLEAVDLTADDIQWSITETYQAAARQVIQGEADAAFFLTEVFDTLANLTKTQLQVLIQSALGDIGHVVLVHESRADIVEKVQQALIKSIETAEGKSILEELGIPEGFEIMTEEDGEFMIDVITTLQD